MENSTTTKKYLYKVKVEKDKTYSWCTCGLSYKQPFCDGKHKFAMSHILNFNTL